MSTRNLRRSMSLANLSFVGGNVKGRLLKRKNKAHGRLLNELAFSALPTSGKTVLIICDPQMDFHAGGKFPNANADQVSLKIAKLLREHGDKIGDVIVTMQLRPRYHIGHPQFWKKGNMEDINEFIVIDKNDLETGNIIAGNMVHKAWVKKYMEFLNKQDVHVIEVFPEHCVIGTKGATLPDSLNDAIVQWEKRSGRSAKYIAKGGNGKVEQYSAFQPLVQLKDDDKTRLDKDLLNRVVQSQRIVVCGHRMEHSVKTTVTDILDSIESRRMKSPPEVILPYDLCAGAPQFEKQVEHFLGLMRSREDILVIPAGNLPAMLAQKFNPGDRSSLVLQSTGSMESFMEPEKFDGVDSLGEGCYLMFDEKNYGSVYYTWLKNSDGDRVKDCIGFFRAGAGKKIPEFKFRKEGRQEIAREIAKQGKNKQFYKACLQFVRDCKSFNGSFMFRTTSNETTADFKVYGLDENSRVFAVENDTFTDPRNFTIISCIPAAANTYAGVTKQNAEIFFQAGDKAGAALRI